VKLQKELDDAKTIGHSYPDTTNPAKGDAYDINKKRKVAKKVSFGYYLMHITLFSILFLGLFTFSFNSNRVCQRIAPTGYVEDVCNEWVGKVESYKESCVSHLSRNVADIRMNLGDVVSDLNRNVADVRMIVADFVSKIRISGTDFYHQIKKNAADVVSKIRISGTDFYHQIKKNAADVVSKIRISGTDFYHQIKTFDLDFGIERCATYVNNYIHNAMESAGFKLKLLMMHVRDVFRESSEMFQKTARAVYDVVHQKANDFLSVFGKSSKAQHIVVHLFEIVRRGLKKSIESFSKTCKDLYDVIEKKLTDLLIVIGKIFSKTHVIVKHGFENVLLEVQNSIDVVGITGAQIKDEIRSTVLKINTSFGILVEDVLDFAKLHYLETKQKVSELMSENDKRLNHLLGSESNITVLGFVKEVKIELGIVCVWAMIMGVLRYAL
jgi:hypothetical protein